MDGGAIVIQLAGLALLASWLFAAGAAIAARRQGASDMESLFLGWLAQRDYAVWNDYIKFKHARESAWRED